MAAQPTAFVPFPDEMLAEARRIIDAARDAGIVLRLVGGIGVLAASRDQGFARRPYRDIDLVGLRRQTRQVTDLFARLDYDENRHVRFASAGQVMQFFRDCVHRDAQGRPGHVDDRIDVYLDSFRLDHEIPLKDRLRLDAHAETAPLADVLLVKLQRSLPNADDLRDVTALLKDVALGDADAPGVVNVDYLAGLCGRDWRLHHDVTRNLARCRALLGELDLDEAQRARVAAALAGVESALSARRKSLRWRLRALPGERLPWSDMVDERDAQRLGVLEHTRF